MEGELWDIIVNGIGLLNFPKDNWKVKWNGWLHLNIWEKELPLFFSEGYPLYFLIARLLNELLSTCLYEYCFHCQPVSTTVTCGGWHLLGAVLLCHLLAHIPSSLLPQLSEMGTGGPWPSGIWVRGRHHCVLYLFLQPCLLDRCKCTKQSKPPVEAFLPEVSLSGNLEKPQEWWGSP